MSLQNAICSLRQYSFEQWDEAQADTSLDELDQSIRLLLDSPELGASRDSVRKGYRVLFINRHAIYHTATASTLRVVRVLHGRWTPSAICELSESRVTSRGARRSGSIGRSSVWR